MSRSVPIWNDSGAFSSTSADETKGFFQILHQMWHWGSFPLPLFEHYRTRTPKTLYWKKPYSSKYKVQDDNRAVSSLCPVLLPPHQDSVCQITTSFPKVLPISKSRQWVNPSICICQAMERQGRQARRTVLRHMCSYHLYRLQQCSSHAGDVWSLILHMKKKGIRANPQRSSRHVAFAAGGFMWRDVTCAWMSKDFSRERWLRHQIRQFL